MATATIEKDYVKAYMTPKQKTKLEKFAKREGKSMSLVVCEALKNHIS